MKNQSHKSTVLYQNGNAQHSTNAIITHDGTWYVATDPETGIASQGHTEPDSLVNLAEALELYFEKEDGKPEM